MTRADASADKRAGIAYLDGTRLNHVLQAGVRRVLAEREHLNKINVFPVPDGDTGTNLALTLGAVAAALAANPSTSAGKVLIRAADSALDGARGNSGAIIAQFLQGLADQLGEYSRIGVTELTAALQRAKAYARDALDKPLEGTVLTVITDVADAGSRLREQGVSDLADFLYGLLKTSKKSLESTRNGLEQMRKAGVVDAGASGFVSLLEGMAEFVRTGSIETIQTPLDIVDNDDSEAIVGSFDDLSFRFCTECMVTGEGIDRRKLRESLSALGNSMVVAGMHRKIKVHIHTNDPAEVFRQAGQFGTVSATKADDMQRQTRSLSATEQKVAVVTDSAADLPDSAYEDLDIHFVPLRVNFGDRSYMDKVSLPSFEFFAELDRNPVHPQTSQPAPGDFRRVYEFLSSHFPQVISISLAKSVSGTWQAATSAAERSRNSNSVTVIDSRSVSVGQGLIAMAAAEYARAGYDGQQLVTAVERAVRATQVFGVVPDLRAAVRGGRIPAWAQWVAKRLGLVPILTTGADGRLRMARIVRRHGDLAAALARHVRQKVAKGKRQRVAIGHAQSPELAQSLHDRLAKTLDEGTEFLSIVEVGAALGTHCGVGALTVAVQELGA